jgi:hypothetical protein
MSGIALATKGVLVDSSITVVNILQCRIKAVVKSSVSIIGRIEVENDIKAKIASSTQIKAIVSCPD